MLIIAAYETYKESNEVLKKLKTKLENSHYQCGLRAWQGIRVRHLTQNTLILSLAMWDHSLEYTNFLHFLNELGKAKIPTLNPNEILKMNADESYLRILEEANLPIIDSIIFKQNEDLNFSQIPFQKAMIKPLVGQNGYKVRFLEQKMPTKEGFPRRALIQSFIESVEELRELCFIFFGGKFSYAVRRQTRKDWRINSNYGAKIVPLKNPNKAHVDPALKALKIPKSPSLLYVRVDLLPQKNGKALISEVELIEPSLYFDFHENVLEQFIKDLFHFRLKANYWPTFATIVLFKEKR